LWIFPAEHLENPRAVKTNDQLALEQHFQDDSGQREITNNLLCKKIAHDRKTSQPAGDTERMIWR